MEIWGELKSIALLSDLRTSESYLVYVISCSSKTFVPILESFPFLFSATVSDYCSLIQNSWFASREAGLLQTAVITALQCLLQTMCMHFQHWRSHKNTCHSRWSPWRRWWARGIQAGADQTVIPPRLKAAVRHHIFSSLPPRQPKRPEQMETHHKAPLKFVCEVKKSTLWLLNLELALLQVEQVHPGQGCGAEESAISTCAFGQLWPAPGGQVASFCTHNEKQKAKFVKSEGVFSWCYS